MAKKTASKVKAVSTAPDTSGIAETALPTPEIIPSCDKASLAGFLHRLLRLEAWAKMVVATVPTIPRPHVDDDIEGT